MDKEKAIEFLKKKAEEIDTLKELSHGNQSVIKWRNSIEDVLEVVFGRNSTEFNRFYNTRINSKVWNRASNKQRLYINQLVNRKTAILSIVQKYKIIGFDSAQILEIKEEKPEHIEISPKAFIAHGGRSGVLDKLCEFIEALGLEPLVVELLPSKGMSVDDKVNKYIKDSDCGIVLATKGGIVDTTGKKPKQHPRLNIIDEVERLRAQFPDRTILLLEKGVELPSNISGLTHEPFARQSMDRAFTAIARELREMGILKTEKPTTKGALT
jgi:predicted nucleotide-binding protein